MWNRRSRLVEMQISQWARFDPFNFKQMAKQTASFLEALLSFRKYE